MEQHTPVPSFYACRFTRRLPAGLPACGWQAWKEGRQRRENIIENFKFLLPLPYTTPGTKDRAYFSSAFIALRSLGAGGSLSLIDIILFYML